MKAAIPLSSLSQLQAPKRSKLTRIPQSKLQDWTPWQTYHPPSRLLPNPEIQPLSWKLLPCYEIHRGGDAGLVFIFSCQVAGFRSQEACSGGSQELQWRLCRSRCCRVGESWSRQASPPARTQEGAALMGLCPLPLHWKQSPWDRSWAVGKRHLPLVTPAPPYQTLL